MIHSLVLFSQSAAIPATSWGSARYQFKKTSKIGGLNDYCDYINMMSYDSNNESYCTHLAPVYPSSQSHDFKFGVVYGTKTFTSAGLDMNKIILGAACYGKAYKVSSTISGTYPALNNSGTLTKIDGIDGSFASGTVYYSAIVKLQSQGGWKQYIEMNNGNMVGAYLLNETSKIFTNRMQELEQRIYELAGEQFNIASPKQVGDILFGKMKIIDKPKKTKTGQFVTSEEVLMQLKHKNEIVEDILNHRGLKKLLGTYIDALPKLINPRTGHIHTSFNQTITATGRLSSSDPNLQNIPIRGEDGKEIRKAFIPEPGCLFFSADYSQIELRVMAHLSQDENMMNVFREGKDLHAATAATIYKKDINEVSRDERTKSKRANFGIIYGITVFGLAERLDIARDEAKQLIDGFFQTFPQVHQYMEASKQKAREKGYAETVFHRRRYLPDINSHNATVRNFAERNAINAPIQGSAADIIKVAMIRIFNRFKAEGIRSKMILQVHDELNFSVYPEEKEIVERIVIEEMQNAFPLSVPLVADSGFGQNWLEAH